MHPQLEKVLELARRAGGRSFILDQNSQQVLVVMSLSDYEKLVDKGAAALEKIGWEDVWAAESETEAPAAEITVSEDLTEGQPVVKEESASTEQFYFEPVEG